mmetsp:Transcript_36214/g.87400  ORF Transcript_36214/g.87400 Transcript_36214/m.87400 type:complete len:233 (+) Transcript_36214:2333-3031(+)
MSPPPRPSLDGGRSPSETPQTRTSPSRHHPKMTSCGFFRPRHPPHPPIPTGRPTSQRRRRNRRRILSSTPSIRGADTCPPVPARSDLSRPSRRRRRNSPPSSWRGRRIAIGATRARTIPSRAAAAAASARILLVPPRMMMEISRAGTIALFCPATGDPNVLLCLRHSLPISSVVASHRRRRRLRLRRQRRRRCSRLLRRRRHPPRRRLRSSSSPRLPPPRHRRRRDRPRYTM